MPLYTTLDEGSVWRSSESWCAARSTETIAVGSSSRRTEGHNWVEEHTPAIYEVVERVMRGLDDEERHAMHALFLKLLAPVK